jgi:hypothetical protein
MWVFTEEIHPHNDDSDVTVVFENSISRMSQDANRLSQDVHVNQHAAVLECTLEDRRNAGICY